MRHHPLRSAPLALAVLAFACSCAQAQTWRADSAPVAIAIQAQPLAEALNEWARQTRIQLIVQQALVQGKVAPAVTGRLTPQRALEQLLAGSGLVASQEGQAVVIKAASPAASSSDATLPEVKVTASRAPSFSGSAAEGYRSSDSGIAGFGKQPLLDTPFSVSVLPTELLTNQGVNDVGLLDRVDASVTSSAASPGTYSQTYVRGLALNSYSNYWYNGQTFLNFQLVGLENKERVEVLSGLSALQAGFSSPGGILNYVTKRPERQPISDLSFGVDEHGGNKVAADLSRRTEDGRFGVRINVASENLRSFVDGADGDRELLAVAADWHLTSSTKLQVDIEHERRSQAFQALLFQNVDGKLPANVDPQAFLGQDWAKIKTKYTMVSGKLEHFFNEDWSMTLEGNWARQERDQHTIILGGIQPNGDANVYNFFAPAQRYTPATVRATARGRFETGPIAHDLAFGYAQMRTTTSWADYLEDVVGTTNIYEPRPLPLRSYQVGPVNLIEEIDERGLFFNDIASLSEAWKVHLGGRYIQRKQTAYLASGAVDGQPYDKSVFTPSVALVFKPRADVSTYVSYIQGLENGGTAPLGTENQTQQLRPLTSKQVEAGIKAELGAVLAQASVFQIDRAAEYTNAGNVYVQDGNQRHRGLQLSLSGKVAPEWTVFGSALLLDAKLQKTEDAATQGKRPMGVPEHRLALVTEYAPRAWSEWVFSGNWTHTSLRELNSTNTGDAAPGYHLFGLGARYATRVGDTPVTFRLNVENLFDQFYWASANGAVVAGAPRTISAGVSIKF